MENRIDDQQNRNDLQSAPRQGSQGGAELNKGTLQDRVEQNSAEQSHAEQGDAGYTHCLNCGEELNGDFCHKCGQARCAAVPNVKDFLVEYANHEFIWDNNFLQTIRHLIVRPGFLSSEFRKGKFVSYTNPLKLNMFLLLVLVTMFLMFSHAPTVMNVVDDIAENDEQLSELIMSTVTDDEKYQEAFEEPCRDTVILRAPRALIDNYPDVLALVDEAPVRTAIPAQTDDTHTAQDAAPTQYMVAVPAILIEEGIIVEDEAGGYEFNNSPEYLRQTLYVDVLSEMWNALLQFFGKYFPLIILLTVPFLSFAVRMVNRKCVMPKIHTFVFSLHYTAFVELLMILIYVISLIFPSMRAVLVWVLAILSFAYLTVAQRRFFDGTAWLNAGLKSLMVNLIYYGICFAVFFMIFFVIIFVYVVKNINTF